jgi:polyhydroxyalkanoate synthesis repressor PhaR
MSQTASSAASPNEPAGDAAKPPVTIKKYANRRLYNTATSSYVTLDNLSHMVKEGTDFVVYDAKSGEDITRSVLTQIIVEEESKGQNMLPIGFLRQLISLYGDSLQFMVPRYLEHSMETFAHNQDRMRQYFKDTMSGMFPFGAFEEMGKQNIALFERAMQMFSPFGPGQGGQAPGQGGPGKAGAGNAAPGAPAAQPPFRPAQPAPAQGQPGGATIDTLLQRLNDLQRQIDGLTGGKR